MNNEKQITKKRCQLLLKIAQLCNLLPRVGKNANSLK